LTQSRNRGLDGSVEESSKRGAAATAAATKLQPVVAAHRIRCNLAFNLQLQACRNLRLHCGLRGMKSNTGVTGTKAKKRRWQASAASVLAGCARQSRESDVRALSVCLGSGYRRCASVRYGAPTGPRRGRSRRRLGTPTLRLRLTGWQIPLELEVVRPCQSRPRSTCSRHRAGACVGLPWPVPYTLARACQQPRACQRRCCTKW
jgi:hypothetical protein